MFKSLCTLELLSGLGGSRVYRSLINVEHTGGA